MVSSVTVVMYLAACVGLVFLPLNEAGYDRYHLPKELWLAGCATAALVVTWKRKVPADLAAWAMFGLLGVAALSGALATTPVLAERGVALIACFIALFLAARTCSDDEAAAVRGAVVIAAAAVAAVVLLESFGLISGLSGPGRAPGGTIGQRNAVAHTLLIVSPAAWTMAASARLRGERVLGLIAVALLAAGIIVTRSRAAWLVLPIALALWSLRTRARVPALAVGVAAALALLLPTAIKWSSETPYRDTAARLVDANTGSGAGRLIQYRATLDLVAAHPLLGVGPGNWMVHYPTVSPPGDPTFRTDGWLHTGRLANSDWLAFLSEGGVLAALLALVVVVGLARRVNAEGLAVLVAVVGVGALDSVVQLPAAGADAAMLLGLTAREAPRDLPRAVRAALCAGLLVAFVFAGRRVLALQERTWPKPTVGGAEAALLWNPYDLQAHFSLVHTYLDVNDCAKARPHIAALRAMLPHHQQPQRMEATCPP